MSDEKLSIGIIESCVDYIRISVPTGTENYDAWRAAHQSHMIAEAEAGAEQVQFNMRHYSMIGYGDAAYGVLNKKGLFQIAGPRAHIFVEDTKGLTLDGKCTRADTKITANYTPDECREATWRLAQQAQASAQENRSLPRDFDLLQRKEKGSTIYFDRDNPSSYARAYQAGIRHPDRYEPSAMSFEIQHNRPTANQAWNMLRSSANLAYCAASLTVGRLDSLGVTEFWRSDIPPTKAPQLKHHSTKEGTLKWIKNCVSGSLKRAQRESWAIEYLVALGLDNLTLQQAREVLRLLEATHPALKECEGDQQCLSI